MPGQRLSTRAAFPPPTRGRSVKERDGVPLHVDQTEFPGSGERLPEEFPASVDIARLTAGEDHAGPFEAGAGQPDGGGDALVSGSSGSEVMGGLVPVAEGGGEDTEVVCDGGTADPGDGES